jgi:hypothetical protein
MARKSDKKENRQRWELYDLLHDRSESTDIAADHPEIVSRMRTQLKQWQDSCAASSNGADY